MRMSNLVQIGNPPWTRDEIVKSIDEFLELYSKRPIKDNQGGMKSPHMFAVWFMARKLNPDLIVESGIWKGQSTWLLEQACPNSKLVAIDLDLSIREYISDSAAYSDRDFSEQNWASITDRSLVFFDDHQNAYERLQQCRWFGFKNVIFEDNYPANQGDCYSLKKAFAGAGFDPQHSAQKTGGGSIPSKIATGFAKALGMTPIASIPQHLQLKIDPNDNDAHMLHKNLEIYYEFPPVIRTPQTRWGDDWNEKAYPTSEPLLQEAATPTREVFLGDAKSYTWICYTRLK